jgi:hypothetical protein
MSIRVTCACGKRYQVAAEHAGKKLRCTKCGAITVVPREGASGATPAVAAPSAPAATVRVAAIPVETVTAPPPPPLPAAAKVWHVHSHNGQRYGPVPRAELDSWAAQRLLSPQCLVWREGMPQWQAATELYPQLALPAATENSSFAGQPDQQLRRDAGIHSKVASVEAAKEDHDDEGDEPYQPRLSATGKKKTLGNLAMAGEIKQMSGASLLSSNVYQVGAARSLMDRLMAGVIVGPIQVQNSQIDSLQLFHFRDSLGEFAAIVPFDNGMLAPTEFVARLPGRLPQAVALLKQSGGKLALEAGAVVGGPLGLLLQQVGSRVESAWAGCDGSVPPLARSLLEQPALSAGIRWEGKIGGGPVSTIYRLGWGVQALPLDDESFLLVAQSVPRQKMLGMEFGVPWFWNYRRQFAQFVAAYSAAHPATECGEFECLDPGVWLASSIEVLHWIEW